MGLSLENILEALEPVNDPELNRSIVELGMVKDVSIKGSSISVEISLTIPGCPLKAKIEQDVTEAIQGIDDVTDVTVTFGRGEDNKASEYANLAKGQGYEPVQKIGVHAQTLKAVVRERLEAGHEMPSDLFKTYAGNSTKITRR